jgi:hypothetical protein
MSELTWRVMVVLVAGLAGLQSPSDPQLEAVMLLWRQ